MAEHNFEICKQLSREIYKKENELPKTIDGWVLIGTIKGGIINQDKTTTKIKANFDSDFGCAAYKKDNAIIIAFQGTDIKKTLNPLELIDVITDCHFVAKKIPPSASIAMRFYLTIIEKYGSSEIYLTGHSLGGAYAQIIASRAIKDGRDVKAITFNAPGLGYAIKPKEREKHRFELLKSISNYVVMNDFIGNFREHAGSTYYVQPYPLNIPNTTSGKGFVSPHSVITDYDKNLNGEILSCPEGWNSKCAWAIWIYDKNPVSKAEKAVQVLLDAKTNCNYLIKAIKIIQNLQESKQLTLLNDFTFRCRRKDFALISNA